MASSAIGLVSASLGIAAVKILADPKRNRGSRVEADDATDLALKDVSFISEVEALFPVDREAQIQRERADQSKRASAAVKDLVQLRMTECGAPGMIVGVAVNGKSVFKAGFGFADVENRVLAQPATVMRIASISKAMTLAAFGRLMDEGKVDLDRRVADLVEEWPQVRHS